MAGRTNTEEASVTTESRNGGSVKTLGIKVPDALHAQFALVAQLDGISLGDAAIRAVELYVATKKAEPDFAARAKAALEAIEREAAARRGAIQGLFGSEDPTADTAEPTTGQTRRRSGEASK
ncbi:hypothetical protein HRW09_02400 [Streptomyces lunaelactis]|nr:hypothetical protein [Streptomyces lunaelactis]